MPLITVRESGLPHRAWSLAGASLFGVGALAVQAEPLRPWALYFWAFWLLVYAGLWWRVVRTDDEGNVEISFLNKLVPWPFWIVLCLGGAFLRDDGPLPWGRWRLFGDDWSGFGLYLLFLAALSVYSLLRLNLRPRPAQGRGG